MILGRDFINSQEEKLYSTGNEMLDNLLERAFCEGYELAQREFGARDRKNARAIARQVQGAEAAANKAAKEQARIQKGIDAVNKAGGIDKVQDREMAMWLKDPKYRKAVESGLGGGPIKSEKIDQITKGAQASTEIAADKVVSRGKTHNSVRTQEGNKFKSSGKELKVSATNEGTTVIEMNGLGPNKNSTAIVSKKSDSRKKNMDNIKNRGIVVTGENNKPKKIKTTINPGVESIPQLDNNKSYVVTETPNKISGIMIGGNEEPKVRSISIPKPETPNKTSGIMTVGNEGPKVRRNSTPKPKPTPKLEPGVKSGFFGKLNTGQKIALGATGAAAIAGGSILLHRHNKKKKEEEENSKNN